MDAIKLKDKQDIRNINCEPADNGGCVIRFTIYTPSMKNSDSTWDEHTEVFSADEVESAAMPRILELYKADLSQKRSSKKPTSDMPMKAEG